LAGEAEVTLDFARAGSDSFFSLFALDKIEDALLTICQHDFMIPTNNYPASSNEQMRF
jgi:hypothetical protein